MKFTRSSVNNRKKELNSISKRFGNTLKSASVKFVIFAFIFIGVVGCAMVFGTRRILKQSMFPRRNLPQRYTIIRAMKLRR